MYCKECGSPLIEGEPICKVCGAIVEGAIKRKIEPIEETKVDSENYPKNETSKEFESAFSWNVHDFPKPKKTQDIDFEWGVKNEDWTEDFTSEATIVNKNNEPKIADNVLSFDKIEEPVAVDKELNVDKIFSFDKKNEEFQELLDREYERLKGQEPAILTKPMKINQTVNSQPNFEITKIEDSHVWEEETVDEVPVVFTDKLKSNEPFRTEDNNFVAGTESFPSIDLDVENTQHTIGVDIEESHSFKESPNSDSAGTETTAPLWFEVDENEENDKKDNRKGCLGKSILILIILILIIEISFLGIKYLWPESEAATKVTSTQIAIAETLNEWKGGVLDFLEQVFKDKEQTSGDELDEGEQVPDPEENEEIVIPIDTNPAQDKSALVDSQMSNNKNIQTIRANNDLVYVANKDYKYTDINNSEPITNNVWMSKEDGQILYYDQEIVATLIAFDSQWIDYVNGGSDEVIQLTKKDSRAYNNVTEYSKVGKVTQTFLLLEIGEIRQGQDGFYAWAYEEIQEVADNKTYIKKYHYIYYLEPVDDQMKIVNYYNF